jgi:ABC-type amino acid transport substrate-binding protein
LTVTRLAPPADQPPAQRFDFAIAVGVRKGDDALRDRLQAALQRRHADIARILAQYGVPLVGETP